nr:MULTISPECIES: tRNA pseudouridine synthase A [unclassified Ornithinimicrobium]
MAYDGTDFFGWAAQPGLRTVEDELSRALGTILRTDPVRLTVGGRTDAGVHARGSVAHADIDPEAWRSLPPRAGRSPHAAAVVRLAGVLPADIVVRSAREVPDSFDARFSALQRRYTYRICDAAATLDPLRRRDTVLHKRPLDVEAMDEAARGLIGLHDFAAFCKHREGATTVRTLLDYSWERGPDGILTGTVVADAFCRSMVRSLVGSVVPVGERRYAESWPTELRAGGARVPWLRVMPAHGLCLEEIVYPPDEELAAQAELTRAVRTLD